MSDSPALPPSSVGPSGPLDRSDPSGHRDASDLPAAAVPVPPGAVAIIGMAGRFPGARNLAEFWRNLSQGIESISFFGRDELAAAGVDPNLLANPSYVPAGSVVEGADLFDSALFGFSPREAELLDPQHRLLLECAWEALEDAAYDPARCAAPVGVYAGASFNNYLLYNLWPAGELAGTQAVLANGSDFLTTRISYKLDLRGPSFDVQTACSTSLVAVALACHGLLSFQCDLALAGGVAIREPQREGYLYQENGILSPDGHCRPFDAAARGTVPGNGVGLVVLKRLEEALADGDRIRAVIRGSAVNNDGAAKVGFTAPSVAGQAEVIGLALAVAGVSPREISFIESHGTATPMGDPIEMRALDRVFRGATSDRAFCALGGVKANIGHTDAAAGVASLIKVVLALEHREIPPLLHFCSPNPGIDLDSGPFYVNRELVPWQPDRLPRRAGVSSFGIGGTNAHVVIEEAPARPAPDSSAAASAPELLVQSARTLSALDRATEELVAFLAPAAHAAAVSPLAPLTPLPPLTPLTDIGLTLRLGRRQQRVRRVVVARDAADAAEALARLDPQRVATRECPPGARSAAFLFPGQGAQHPAMAAEVYRAEPVFREHLDACSGILSPLLGCDLARLLAGDADAADPRQRAAEEGTRDPFDLGETALAQPALFAVEYSLAQLWMSWGIRPAAMLGHSLGELVAACLAGVLSLQDALGLVVVRGRLMQSLPAGAMLALSLPPGLRLPSGQGPHDRSPEELLGRLWPEQGAWRDLAGGLDLAAINAPDRLVLSGPAEEIGELAARIGALGAGDAKLAGLDARPLQARHAFHSRDVEPLLEAWIAAVRRVSLAPPRIPYLSNVSGGWVGEAEATSPEYWGEHLRRAVQFSRGVAELMGDPLRVLLEVGPGQTLTSLARRQPAAAARPGAAGGDLLASLPHREAQGSQHAHLLMALGRAWLAGLEVDWAAFQAGRQAPARRLALPTYPFERKRHWIAAPATPPRAAAVQDRHAEAAPDPGGGEGPIPAPGSRETAAFSLRQPVWRQEPLRPDTPRAGAASAGEEPVWLVLAGGGSLDALVLDRLRHDRHRRGELVAVTPGPALARISTGAFVVDPTSAESFAALFQALGEALPAAAGPGSPAAARPLRILDLWPLALPSERAEEAAEEATPEPGGPGPDARPEWRPGQARHLVPLAAALRRLADSGRTLLGLDVASRGALEVAGTAPQPAAGAALVAACRAAAAALPGLPVRLVDVVVAAPGTPQERRLAGQIHAELVAGGGGAHDGSGDWASLQAAAAHQPPRPSAPLRPLKLIAYRGLGRWVEHHEELEAGATPVADGRPGGYLIGGTWREALRALAEELAAAGTRGASAAAGPPGPAHQGLRSAPRAVRTVAVLVPPGASHASGAPGDLDGAAGAPAGPPGSAVAALGQVFVASSQGGAPGSSPSPGPPAGPSAPIPSPLESKATGGKVRAVATGASSEGGQGDETAPLDRLCTSYVASAFAARGVEVAPGRAISLPELRRRLGLRPKFERLLERLIEILAEDGIAERQGEELRFLAAAHLAAPDELREEIVAAVPQLRGLTALLDHCARQLPQVLAGEIDGLNVIYPGGSPELVQGAAQETGSEEQGADRASLRLHELLDQALAGVSSGPVRVLEAGAGHGTLTRLLLPALANCRGRRGLAVEYHFTDLGRSFVLRAERELGAEQEGVRLRYGVLDASRDPVAQGYAAGDFHLVVAFNVVHATRRVADTLGHLRTLLAPGGWIALVETVRRQRWADLVWGLTDGWWMFEDTDLRRTGPLLREAAWREVFQQAGLVDAVAAAGDEPAGTALLLGRRPWEPPREWPAAALLLAGDPADARQVAAAVAEARAQLGGLRGVLWASAEPETSGGPSPNDASAAGAPESSGREEAPAVLRHGMELAAAARAERASIVAFLTPDVAAWSHLSAFAERRMLEEQGHTLALLWEGADGKARDDAGEGNGGPDADTGAAGLASDSERAAESRRAAAAFLAAVHVHQGGAAIPRLIARSALATRPAGEPSAVPAGLSHGTSTAEAGNGKGVPGASLATGAVAPGEDAGEAGGALALHDRPQLLNPYLAPRDDVESEIVAIWRRALGIEHIGVEDNFLELGGDSLVGLQVVHQVQERFDLGGRTFTLYDSPTVAAIAQLVRGGSDEGSAYDLRAGRGERRRESRKTLKGTRHGS